MSLTAAQAFAALRARAEAQLAGWTLVWQDEPAVLPDVPAPFVYVELMARRGRIAGYGGGRGSNLYRMPAELTAYVFWPRGEGLAIGLGYAETVAAVFRSWRSGDLSCVDATVHPLGEGETIVPNGSSSAAGNYSCAAVRVTLHYDQLG